MAKRPSNSIPKFKRQRHAAARVRRADGRVRRQAGARADPAVGAVGARLSLHQPADRPRRCSATSPPGAARQRDWMSLDADGPRHGARRDRRRGQQVLRAQRLRLRGDRGCDEAQRVGRAHPRRIDDQPADRQERLPVAGRRLCPQGRRGVVHLPDRAICGASAGSWRSISTSPRPASAPMAPTPGRMRYFGHDASAMSATEAARIAAILPLPKKRGAIAPKGFTRRYGNTHRRADRRGRPRRARCLRLCGHDRAGEQGAAGVEQAAARSPGDEYETATPPPPEPSVDDAAGRDEPVAERAARPTAAGRASRPANRCSRAPSRRRRRRRPTTAAELPADLADQRQLRRLPARDSSTAPSPSSRVSRAARSASRAKSRPSSSVASPPSRSARWRGPCRCRRALQLARDERRPGCASANRQRRAASRVFLARPSSGWKRLTVTRGTSSPGRRSSSTVISPQPPALAAASSSALGSSSNAVASYWPDGSEIVAIM